MADKIATREFCNTLKTGAFSSDLKKCPVKSEITQAGLTVNGEYGDNQLVIEKDIMAPIEIIVIGNNGYIEKLLI